MELIAEQGERRFWFLRVEPPYETLLPRLKAPFVAIVIACDPLITTEQQGRISAQLVAHDCRYMLACGHNATSWDDSVDWAYIESDPDFDPSGDRFVMTTWHDHETLEELILFALTCTNFESHHFHEYLALMIGPGADIESELRTAIRSQMVSK